MGVTWGTRLPRFNTNQWQILQQICTVKLRREKTFLEKVNEYICLKFDIKHEKEKLEVFLEIRI